MKNNLKIEIPMMTFSGATVQMNRFAWCDTHEQITKVNKLIDEGLELTGWKTNNNVSVCFENNTRGVFEHTHKALLLDMQPIKKKTREEQIKECLKEFVEIGSIGDKADLYSCWAKAEKLLGKPSDVEDKGC